MIDLLNPWHSQIYREEPRWETPAGETPPRNTSPRKHLRGVPQVRPHLGGGGIGEVGDLAGVKEAGRPKKILGRVLGLGKKRLLHLSTMDAGDSPKPGFEEFLNVASLRSLLSPSANVRLFSSLAVLGFLTIIYLLFLNPVLALYTKTVEVRLAVGDLQAALGEKDLGTTKASLIELEVKLSEFKDAYRRIGYLRFAPLIDDYYCDGSRLLDAASFALEGGKIAIEAIEPFEELLGLKEGFGDLLTTEQRVANLAGVLPQIAPQVDAALGELFLVKAELDQIDPSRYPEDIWGIRPRFWLEEGQKILSELEPFLAESKSIVEILPHLLGVSKRTYLILFQNDAELRATGGFMTYYALITLKSGKIIDSEFMGGARVHRDQPYERPPDPIKRYLGVRAWHLQDSNFSPDFPSSAAALITMWKKSKLPPIEGIIAITTEAAREVLDLTGPIRLIGYDRDLTNTNLPDDCRTGGVSFTATNLVCRLEYYVEKHSKGGTDQRKAIVGKLSEIVIEKITSSSAKIWPQLLDLAFELLDQKDILLYSTDPREQELIEELGYAGRVRDFEGDYLHISDSNLGGKKTDLYMQETVEQSLTKLENGKWRKTVKINYHNPQKYDNWLSANYRDFVRIYVPEGSKLVKIEGASQEWGSWTELGKTVFGAFFTLWPQRDHTLTFVYDLPSEAACPSEPRRSGVAREGPYRLLIQKQPGANITLVKVKIGGKMESFDLRTDKEITLSVGE